MGTWVIVVLEDPALGMAPGLSCLWRHHSDSTMLYARRARKEKVRGSLRRGVITFLFQSHSLV